MIEHSEQTELFEKIGKTLRKKTEVYTIGGTALMFYGVKERTKDVDLVFLDEKVRRRFADVLCKKFGYVNALKHIKILIKDYAEMKKKPLRLEAHGKPNFDLFLKYLGPLQFSERMKERCTQRHDFDNLSLLITAPEDILLLKSITDRVTDKEDAALIINKFKIDFDAIKKEAAAQNAEFFLEEFLDEVKKQFKLSKHNL